MFRFVSSALFLGLCAAPASACSLALVLALDVSASVDSDEYQLQQEGLASALTDPAVVSAIQGQGGIWLTAYEWSGARHQYEQLPWTFVTDADTAFSTAQQLRAANRRMDEFPTSLGFALGYGLSSLERAPEPCSRRVIDVSGDGMNNDGFGPDSAYAARDMRGITINGLVIANGTQEIPDYYRETVIYGPGAFIEIADDYEDYHRAMRMKLLREIGVRAFASIE